MSTSTNPSHLETAQQLLLRPTGIDTSSLQGVLGQMMSHQVDYADLYFQYSRSESWGLEEGQVKSGNFSIDQGVGENSLRVF
jgi:TldD protein